MIIFNYIIGDFNADSNIILKFCKHIFFICFLFTIFDQTAICTIMFTRRLYIIEYHFIIFKLKLVNSLHQYKCCKYLLLRFLSADYLKKNNNMNYMSKIYTMSYFGCNFILWNTKKCIFKDSSRVL